MHERAALRAGEDGVVDALAELFLAQDDGAARAAQRLVGGRRHDVCVGYGRGVHTSGNQAADVRDVDHEVRADLVGDVAELLPVDEARIGACAGDDDLRRAFLGLLEHLVIVDHLGLGAHAVGDGVPVAAGDRGARTVREVTASIEAHAQDGVARLQQRCVHGDVCLGTSMRLHVGVLGLVQRLGTADGDLLDMVDVLAAAIEAGARWLPMASMTASLVKFSDAISSMWSRWRSSSSSMM